MATVPFELPAIVSDFDRRVRQLYASRPYWLIGEHDVRSAFVAAAITKISPTDHWEPRHACVEYPLGQRAALDFVFDLAGHRVAVEFKTWNIVTKPCGDAARSGNANDASAQTQWRSILADAKRLAGFVGAQTVSFTGLVAVCAQHAFGDAHLDLVGPSRKKPIDASIEPMLSPAGLQNGASDLSVTECSPHPSPFRCARGTTFSLRIFEVRTRT